jgi:hypothetical protein
MKRILLSIFFISLLFVQLGSYAQDKPIYPNVIKTPIAFEVTGRLDANPIVTETDFSEAEFFMNAHRDREINPDILPPDFENMPVDPGMQTKAGWIENQKVTLQNFAGQSSGSYPPDANGTVGANYYFQTVNTTYAIYNKATGATVAGPSPLNSIFNSSLPGANCNNGDPIVLWDEQADRWFYAEFSLCGSNDFMLIAVSQTNNPTGSWYSWSFDVDDMPDYMKFGIWQDGYYMATNTSPGNDVYVFDRATMIAGGASPTMIGYDNSWRPSTFDGFHCILPLDNDGPWAPSGDPGQFITIVDDGQGNSADQLWIYELDVNWSSPGSSTFNRVQTLNVNSFSGNFNSSWNNIPQSGTSTTLDGLSTILMFRAQYRNFSGTQRLVCAHAIAESSSEAAMRWYELENTGSTWSIRQQGTYNPDNVSRWNMSIAMNGAREIGIGYSVSNSSMNPGIRYIGQSTASNTAANNTLDMAETVIQNGSYSQSTYNRWGDYANISVDPTDDHTFWFTSEYMGSSTHLTRIASFQFSTPSSPPNADFSASTTTPANSFTTVNFTNLSTGTPTLFYTWTFSPSTVTYVSGSSTSQNPSVRFNNPGAYTVSLQVVNSYGNVTETKTDYIHMGLPGNWTGATSTNWNTATNWENHMIPTSSDIVQILPTAVRWPTKTGNLTLGTDCGGISMASAYTELTVTGDLTITSGTQFYVDPSGMPNIYVGGNWINSGTFSHGMSTVEFYGTSNSNISLSKKSGKAIVTSLNENFDGGSLPLGWTTSNTSSTVVWNVDSSPNPPGYRSASYSLNYNDGTDFDDGAANSGTVTTSAIDNSNATSTTISFWYQLQTEDGQSWDWVQIDILRASDNAVLQSVGGDGASIPDISTWTNYSITGNAAVIAESSIKLRFKFQTDDNQFNTYFGWFIDDLLVEKDVPILSTAFYNVNSNKSNGGLVTAGVGLDIMNDFIIEPGSYFTNASGNNLNVNGNTMFKANASGMASFVDNGTSSFAIPANVELYLSDANPGAWHFISSPVAGAQSGLFTGNYLYSFNEGTDSWVNIVPENITLNQMQGYSAWTPNGFPQHIVFSGTPNNGALSIPVTMNTTQTDQGWNLVGNPYPSSLDWDAAGWTKNNVNNTLYFFSGSATHNYQYYIGAFGETPSVGTAGGTNIIPPLQGFFVHASGAGTLGVGNAQRVHSNQAYYKEGQIELPQIRIVAEGNGITDETVIRFYNGATNEFDGDYDAYKLFADNIPQVNSVTPSGTDLAINTLNAISENLVIPLSFNAPMDGQVSFTITEIIGIDGELYIEDLLNEEIEQVFENSVFAFDHSPINENVRFLLHFGNPIGMEENYFESVSIYSEGNTVYVNNPSGIAGEIMIYDIMGQEIYKDENTLPGLSSIKLSNGTGYYLVKIQSGTHLISEKIFIK